MKRTIALILTVLMALSVLAACGQTGNNGSDATASVDASQFKNMGEVFAFADLDDYLDISYTDTYFTYAFKKGETDYRAVAEISEEICNTLFDLDFGEDYDQNVKDIVSPLEVAFLDNLTEMMPTQEELDKLVGKTGQELFDDDWYYFYYNLEDMDTMLEHGIYEYNVVFEYDGDPMENTDDFDFYEAFSGLKVKSVKCLGVGDATYWGEE